jgi:hypothetical protein
MASCDADVRVGGSYRYVLRLASGSQFAFDAIIASGMEGGMRETMDQLDELVAMLA